MGDNIYDSASILKYIINTVRRNLESLVIHEIPKIHQNENSQKQETHCAMHN